MMRPVRTKLARCTRFTSQTIGILLGTIHIAAIANMPADQPVRFTDAEKRQILRHGPWPIAFTPDPSNRASGDRHAIELGEKLFFDRRLSGSGTVSCGSCHQPDLHWTDGERRAAALGRLDRNTPHLLNMRHNRWFGWDGASDSLWSQIMRPILDARELGSSPQHVAAVIRGNEQFACKYEKALGKAPATDDDEGILVGASKALAAFVETLRSDRTRFDDFRDALERDDQAAMTRYGSAAQRGLKLFIGKGNCTTCHTGPNFTNGEFHDSGVPYFIAPGRVDPGRHGGIKALAASRFNLLGRYNDDAKRSTATGTRHVALEHRNWGEFRVPSLRHTAFTMPYMHNGSMDSLRDVVRHYSELNEERVHADGERLLKPLKLSERESNDLIVFLESLTNLRTVTWRETPHMAPCN